MKKIEPFSLIVLGGLVLLGVVAIILGFRSPEKKTNLTTYQSSDQEKPQIEISQTSFDFGPVGVMETKIQDISIKNTGTKTLQLTSFGTSCDCTFAQMVIDGQESPRFSMHNNPQWLGEILPGNTAVLKAIYEPKIMPVKGKIDRTIYFRTNDPLQPEINIQFTAEVF